ncbi:hypothetical protein XOCgx_4677 [Xanthomonas oryzae pv. oryzicola]|nr:hypothetical protein XOCgx_4677 [Xanthomonas oryzae pv. oryzicola]
MLQNRADLLEPLTAHVTWIVLLAHSWSLHGLKKIVNRFLVHAAELTPTSSNCTVDADSMAALPVALDSYDLHLDYEMTLEVLATIDKDGKVNLISPDFQLPHLRTYRETSSIECRDDVMAKITLDRLFALATPTAHVM